MSSASSATTASPWADLLSELCDLVRERLYPINILRCPAVCKGWSTAHEEYPRLRPGTPALLTSGLDPYGCEIKYNVETGAFGLHDVSNGGGGCKSFLGEAEGLKGRTWVGGNHGWLATMNWWCDIELLNPVTGAWVRLPSFATIIGVEVHNDLQVCTAGGYLFNNMHNTLKVTLCRTPAHADSHLAVAIFSEGLLAFTVAGGGGKGKCRWTVVKNPAADVSYMDVIILDGKLFVVNELGHIYLWHLDGGATMEPVVVQGQEIDEIIHHHDRDRIGFYLAASSGGHQRLLLIYIHGYEVEDVYKYGRMYYWDSHLWRRLVFGGRRSFRDLGMSLHELDAGSGTWRCVMDLGADHTLSGANYPFFITVQHGRGSEIGLEADCVYLVDTPYGYDTAIFDLKKGDYRGDSHIKRQLAYSLVDELLQMPMWYLPTDYPH